LVGTLIVVATAGVALGDQARVQSLETYLTTLDFGPAHQRPSAASCQDRGNDKYLCVLTINGNPLEFAVTVRNGRTVDATLSQRQRRLCVQARPDVAALVTAVQTWSEPAAQAAATYLRAHMDRPNAAQLRRLSSRYGAALGRLARHLQGLRMASPWGREFRALLVRDSLAVAGSIRAYVAGQLSLPALAGELRRVNDATERARHRVPCFVTD
jgi:hypothetical protein